MIQQFPSWAYIYLAKAISGKDTCTPMLTEALYNRQERETSSLSAEEQTDRSTYTYGMLLQPQERMN